MDPKKPKGFVDGDFKLGVETRNPGKKPAGSDASSEDERLPLMPDEEEQKQVRSSFFPSNTSELPPLARKKTEGLDPAQIKAIKLHRAAFQLVNENPVFRKFPVEAKDEESRNALPFSRDPNVKLNVWALLKDNIGKDLTRVAMPVYLNEPLSMLQKVAEVIEHSELLRRANRAEDPLAALLLVTAFYFAPLPLSNLRLKKPFNSLLGETFDLETEDARYFAEQVLHHPPVSAFHCEAPDFEFWGHIQLKTSIGLSGLDITPKGPLRVRLRRSGFVFDIKRPKISVHNIIMGTMHIWYQGDSEIVNETTGDRALLHYKSKGWTSSGDCEVGGHVETSAGKKVFKLKGLWDDHLSYCRIGEEAETLLYRKTQLPAQSRLMYNFTEFQMSLNHLNDTLLRTVPPTDSRLRPDQRAYEYGDLELATAEKTRLEEKQRAVRKAMEKNKQKWAPLWFDVKEVDGKAVDFVFRKELYRSAKKKHQWPDNTPDLFN